MTEHWVHLVERVHSTLQLGGRHTHLFGDRPHGGSIVRKELMQRRVQQTHGDRKSLHGGEDSGEILALVREQFLEGLASIGFGLGQDHLSHRHDAIAFKEHVFGPGQTDALGTEISGTL